MKPLPPLTPKELAKIFSEMYAEEQQYFFQEVNNIFSSWGTYGKDRQIDFMTSYMDKPTKDFILKIGEFINE